MFIVFIFFLIYGVEVYFKVRILSRHLIGKRFWCLSMSVAKSYVPVFWNVFLFYFHPQVRGGFLNDRESTIPLGIMSFKTSASSSSSPACVSSFVTTSSQIHTEHINDKDTEEKEATVHLIKEEACYHCLLFCLRCLFVSPWASSF